LNASVAGDVFASPSARQVGGAIERVGSDKGVILIITNCEFVFEFGRAERAWRDARAE